MVVLYSSVLPLHTDSLGVQVDGDSTFLVRWLGKRAGRGPEEERVPPPHHPLLTACLVACPSPLTTPPVCHALYLPCAFEKHMPGSEPQTGTVLAFGQTAMPACLLCHYLPGDSGVGLGQEQNRPTRRDWDRPFPSCHPVSLPALCL